MKVAVVQLTSIDDVTANVDQILNSLKKITAVDLVCLPENALFFRISKNQKMPSVTLDHPELLRLQKWVDEHKAAMMIGSVPFYEGEDCFNATVFLEPGTKPQVLYSKIHLFDVDVPGAPPVRESESFRHGKRPTVINWRGWKVGLSICYDVRFSELYNLYGRENVDLILIPSAFLVPTGQAHWEILVRARAIENQCFVVAAAQGGEHVSASGEKRHTFGHSMIVSPWGEKLVELVESPSVGVFTLDKKMIEQTRARIPMQQHRGQRGWERL